MFGVYNPGSLKCTNMDTPIIIPWILCAFSKKYQISALKMCLDYQDSEWRITIQLTQTTGYIKPYVSGEPTYKAMQQKVWLNFHVCMGVTPLACIHMMWKDLLYRLLSYLAWGCQYKLDAPYWLGEVNGHLESENDKGGKQWKYDDSK